MRAIKEIVEVSDNKVIIQLPKDFNSRKVEIIVLPFEEKKQKQEIENIKATLPKRKCGRLLNNIRREDIYIDER